MHIANQESRGHISPTKVYFFVGTGLLILTVITVAASYIDWGSTLINVCIALAIASLKASLVILFFMHMKYEDKFIWGYGIIYPIIIFSIMVGFISLDIFQRVIPIPTP